ncbi:MAG: RNase adapter RapZ [Thermodesulfobacteriota bacterium]
MQHHQHPSREWEITESRGRSFVNHTGIIIITGLSGSGKSTAIAAFEDAGFYCVDNMPVALLPKFLELPFDQSSDIAGLVFGMDLREKDFISKYPDIFSKLSEKGYRLDILFLEADEDVLMRRYSQTRRQHPLAPSKGILDAIRTEKRQLEDLRRIAGTIIDTSKNNVHELKSAILKFAREKTHGTSMRIQVMSFGFKYGTPQHFDLIIDVRFLANPYFTPELKPLDGETDAVKNFVLCREETRLFLKKYLDLLDYLIPLYEKEGKAYLTIAFGCTGGRHRSVAIAKIVHEHLRDLGKQVELIHRDIDN